MFCVRHWCLLSQGARPNCQNSSPLFLVQLWERDQEYLEGDPVGASHWSNKHPGVGVQPWQLVVRPLSWSWSWWMFLFRGERIVFWWPNTNTNIIRLPKNDRIRIRILFGFTKMTEYEYEYYSVFQKWPNTNIIRFEKGDRIRIRILFGLKKAAEYENKYYLVWKIDWIQIKI